MRRVTFNPSSFFFKKCFSTLTKPSIFSRINETKIYSEPLYNENDVKNALEYFRNQFPNTKITVREFTPPDFSGYHIVSVEEEEEAAAPSLSQSICK